MSTPEAGVQLLDAARSPNDSGRPGSAAAVAAPADPLQIGVGRPVMNGRSRIRLVTCVCTVDSGELRVGARHLRDHLGQVESRRLCRRSRRAKASSTASREVRVTSAGCHAYPALHDAAPTPLDPVLTLLLPCRHIVNAG